MTRSRKLVSLAAGLALAMPAVALAQDDPPETEVRDEVLTGSRIQHIVVIGAIKDRRQTRRAERPTDRRVPELPVVYEDAPARSGR